MQKAVLDEYGNIEETTSENYGMPPDSDIVRKKRLLKWGWLWLLIPIVGIVPYVEIRRELTDKWGQAPWWY